MALDAHLNLLEGGAGKIEGEGKNEGFLKQVQLISWSWGASNAGSSVSGGGLGGGKASFQDFHFTMQMSKASPIIVLFCATGQVIDKATLTLRKAGKSDLQQTFLTIEFKELMISSYATGGTDESGLPIEQISLNYASFVINYHEQDKQGKLSVAGTAGYDLKTNKKVG